MYCQQTKEKLELIDGAFQSVSIDKKYQIYNDIVFMGYERTNEDILQILNDSKKHQMSESSYEKHNSYSKISYPLIIQSLLTYKKLYSKNQGIAVNVGSGGAPSSNEISKIGFKTYSIELEPDVLYVQSLWDEVLKTKVNRIACDGFDLPFPNDSVDFLYCKEFLHHIEDYDTMIAEFSRVLKHDAILLLIEPTLTHRTLKDSIEFPGHHYNTNSSYINSFKKNNLSIDRYYLNYLIKNEKFKHKLISFYYSYQNRAFLKSKNTNSILMKYCQKIFDGHNIWYLRKNKTKNKFIKVLDIKNIDKEFLTLNSENFTSYKNNEFIQEMIRYYLKLRNDFEL